MCKDWVWYKFYTSIKNESTKIIMRKKEEEKRRLMQVKGVGVEGVGG
jgi:hypothetical protein